MDPADYVIGVGSSTITTKAVVWNVSPSDTDTVKVLQIFMEHLAGVIATRPNG